MKKTKINIITFLFIIEMSHHISYGSDYGIDNTNRYININNTIINDEDYLFYSENGLDALSKLEKIFFSSVNWRLAIVPSLKDTCPNLLAIDFSELVSSYNPLECDLHDPLRIFLANLPSTLNALTFHKVSSFLLPVNLNEMCPSLETLMIIKLIPPSKIGEEKRLNMCLDKLPFSLKKLTVSASHLETLPDDLSEMCPNLESLNISYNENFKSTINSSIISPSIKFIDMQGIGPSPYLNQDIAPSQGLVISLKDLPRPEGIMQRIECEETLINSIYAPHFEVSFLFVDGRSFKNDEKFFDDLNINHGELMFFNPSAYLVGLGINSMDTVIEVDESGNVTHRIFEELDEDERAIVLPLTEEQEQKLSSIFIENKNRSFNARFFKTKPAASHAP